MGNSLGCSPSGERLVSAARDGDLQEAQALLDFNPRLAKYSTFGVRNSPLHFAAAQGHNEIVSLLLESGLEVNVRNYSGQTALMQACRNGHWEVVQTLILFRANVNRADYLNGRTALHFAAANGHARCARLLFADYFPSSSCSLPSSGLSTTQDEEVSVKACQDNDAIVRIVNRPSDGGITALHMAALNGHADCVILLLDLMADVSAETVQDGTNIDLIGIGSNPLHYAACGGDTACCQILLSRGASRTRHNANGWTPLQVARLWGRHWLEPLLDIDSPASIPAIPSSRHLALPLMSIIRIARECGWRNLEACPGGVEACAVCLERRCTVAAEGCAHELCTKCALYLCSTSTSGPAGSIPCPLCRQEITAFVKLPCTPVVKEFIRPNLSLSLCTVCSAQVAEPMTLSGPIQKVEFSGCNSSLQSPNSLRTMSCSGINLPFTCNGEPDGEGPHVSRCSSSRSDRRDQCLWPTPRNSVSSCLQVDGRWWFQNLLPAVT